MSNKPVTSINARKRGHDEVLDRVHTQHLQRVELLAHLARAEVGRDRSAGDAGDYYRRDGRADLSHRAEHEDRAESIQRTEDGQEVAACRPRARSRCRQSRSVAETSTAAARARTARQTRHRRDTEDVGRDQMVRPVRIIMSPVPRASPLPGRTPARRRCEPSLLPLLGLPAVVNEPYAMRLPCATTTRPRVSLARSRAPVTVGNGEQAQRPLISSADREGSESLCCRACGCLRGGAGERLWRRL